MAENTPMVTPTPIAPQLNRSTPEKKKQHPKSEKGVLALERTLVYIFLILLTLLWWCIQLQEVSERLELNVQEVRIRHRILYRRKVNSVIDDLRHLVNILN